MIATRLLKNKKFSDLTLEILIYVIIGLILILTIYPLFFILIASISNQFSVASGEVILIPKGLTLKGYEKIFTDSRFLIGYRNTIFYMVAGTLINILLTIPAAYALSRKDFMLRKIVMFFFVITLFFNGGLIPTYLTIKALGLINTVWVMLIPFSVNVFYLIIARTYFESNIPEELFDGARIDGCTNTKYFVLIVLPLSKVVLAVMCIYYSVLHWNEFFMALIYIRSTRLYPLQLVLRDILVMNQVMMGAVDSGAAAVQVADLIKYGAILVSTLPMLIIYPFFQRFFTKGVMIGALK